MQELAIASVPMQQFRLLYPAARALQRGTLFAELEKPWAPDTAPKGDCCHAKPDEAPC